LTRWAERIRAWRAGFQPEDAHLISNQFKPQQLPRDIYCYFDNDIKVKAPFDAQALIAKL
jgi:uncharacterized protein YecE (DUF72 family)